MRTASIWRPLLAGALLVTGLTISGGDTATARLDETGGGEVADLGTGALATGIAYNPDRNEYVAAIANAQRVLAVRTDASGNQIGTPAVVAESGPDTAVAFETGSFWKPGIAYDAVSKQYLVTFVRDDAIESGGIANTTNRGAVIKGRVLDSTGQPTGAEARLNDRIGNFFFCFPRYPDVTAHRNGGWVLSYSLLWATTSTSPTAECEDLEASQTRPVLQRIATNLASPGRVLPTDPPIASGTVTRVDHNLDTGQTMLGVTNGSITGSVAILYDAGLNPTATADVEFEPPQASSGTVEIVQPVADRTTGNWTVLSTRRFFALTYSQVFSNTGAELRGPALIPDRKFEDAAAVGDGSVVAVTLRGHVVHIGADGSRLFESQPFGGSRGPSYRTSIATDGGPATTKVVAVGLTGETPADAHATVGLTVTPPAIRPIVPARLLDTRTNPNATTIDGEFLGGGVRPAGSTLELTVAGRGGVPTDADAAVLNVTAVQPQARGFVTVFPCGEERPGSSNLNLVPGANRANSVISKIGDDGKVCLFTSAPTHLLADVGGVVPLSNSLASIVPARVLETRSGPTAVTIDGRFEGAGPRPAGTVTRVELTGRGGVPDAARSVLLNVTAVRPTTGGFITVFSCDDDRPVASNLNMAAGDIVPNLVFTELSASGEVCIFSSATTDLLVDVMAHGSATSGLFAVTPARLLETRTSPGTSTIDGISQGSGPVAGASVTTIMVAGRGGVPDDASGAMLNLTAVRPTTNGFFTAYPCDEPQPDASNLNFDAGQVVANAVSVKLSSTGTVCVFASSASNMLLDVTGFVVD